MPAAPSPVRLPCVTSGWEHLGTDTGGGTATRAEHGAGDATTHKLPQLDGAEGSPEPQEGPALLR